MKFLNQFNTLGKMKMQKQLVLLFLSLACAACAANRGPSLDPNLQRFDSPKQAINALLTATASDNLADLTPVVGEPIFDLLSEADRSAVDARKRTALALAKEKILVETSPTGAEILIGEGRFNFPIPLKKDGNSWFFDGQEGRRRIIERNVLRNEKETVGNLVKLQRAQEQYRSNDWDGDGVKNYAQRIRSSKGRDGLYWEAPGEESVLPLRAALAEGPPSSNPTPIAGYAFKLLSPSPAAGTNSPQAGFAALAYPIKYGKSGRRSFITTDEGKIYMRDLGESTNETAEKMTELALDSSWQALTRK